MNRECHIKDNSAPWDTLSIEDVNEMSQLELYLLEHQLEVCSIPKSAIRDLTYPIIKIALLPDSRFHIFAFMRCSPLFLQYLSQGASVGVVASPHNDKNIGVQETLISAIKSIHWKVTLK